MNPAVEEVAIAASESPSKLLLNQILDATRPSTESTDAIKESIDMMLDAWGERIEHEPLLAQFVLDYCSKITYSTPVIRRALTSAVKLELPPYLAKPGFQRSLGLRERNIPTSEVVARFRNLMALSAGQYCFIPESKTFAKIGQVDDVTGALVMHSIPESTIYRIPLDTALASFIFFAANGNVLRLIQPPTHSKVSAQTWIQSIQQYAVRSVKEADLTAIAQAAFVPNVMTQEALIQWLQSENSEQSATAHVKKRTPGECRNLAELEKIINAELELNPSFKISEQDVEQLTKFFDGRRAPDSKELKLVVEVLAIMEQASVRPQLANILSQYKDRVMFWPHEDTTSINLEDLEIWGHLTAKQLPHLIKTTERIFSPEYLLYFAPLLPMKALNALFADKEPEFVRRVVFNIPNPTSDVLLWVWRNRRTLPKDMMDILTIDHIINAIVMRNLPKAWGPAQRELRRLLIDDIQLIKTVLDNADEVRTIIYAVQRAKGFSQGEQQSLLVKLARHSEELKEILEQGEGRRMMANAQKDGDATTATVQPLITSLKSFNVKRAELDHLINVLIPQNRVAIETARAHGDFRENSEYDVAKADRRYLTSQRTQMERDLDNAQPVDFATVVVEDHVIAGSTVTFKTTDGQTNVYHVVGAFDSNPELSCVSYRAPIGEALMGHAVNDKVELPGKVSGTIVSISQLDPKIVKLLAE